MIYVYVNELFEEGYHYLTAGKRYEVHDLEKYVCAKSGEEFRCGIIIDDEGEECFTLIDEPTAHLGLDCTNSWIVEEV